MITSVGQSFLDLAIQMNGDVLSALDIASFNKMSITDDIAPRSIINEGITTLVNNDIKLFFEINNRKIATAFTPELGIIEDYGFPEGEFPIGF